MPTAKELAAELLAVDPPGPPTRLFVKAWKREVFLVDPTADLRDEWDIFRQDHRGRPASWRAKLASLLLCDAEGHRLYTAADVPALGKLRHAGLHEIFEAGAKLLDTTDADVEEAAKN
jgi:hypothetical protein